jgi:hypothetical protein
LHSRRNLFWLLVFFIGPCFLNAQDWKEGLFGYLSGQYYVIPGLASTLSPDLAEKYGVSKGVISYPGFRAGAGWEWRHWSFGLESGYSYIKGDNPLILDIFIVPLLFKAGYSFFPIKSYEQFSLTPAASLGIVFAAVDHYRDVIDMLTERQSHLTSKGLFAQLGIRAGWNPVKKWGRAFEVFAGLSVDAVASGVSGKQFYTPQPYTVQYRRIIYSRKIIR